VKICTITCHDVYNPGASLQAYALMTYLKNDGYDVEIINYKPKYLDIDFVFFAVNSPWWNRNFFLKLIYLVLHLPKRISDLPVKFAFDSFRRKYLSLTAKRYRTNEELRKDPPIADVYICGSDQIWNSNLPNGRDPAFYLDFAPSESIKMSYAASFAMDHIPEQLKMEIRDRINNINYISVRESDAIGLLHDIGIDRGIHVLDPVFLLTAKQWEEIAKPAPKEKYILIFNFDNDQMILETAKKIAAIKKCSIYDANMIPLKGLDKNLPYAAPDEFLGLIKNAEYIVTNSFHAIAFALIFHVEFIALGRTEKLNSRMINLLQSVRLENRYVMDSEFDAYQLATIDFQKIEKKIDEMKRKSIQFIDHALRNKIQ
jgi:hypothetical protein